MYGIRFCADELMKLIIARILLTFQLPGSHQTSPPPPTFGHLPLGRLRHSGSLHRQHQLRSIASDYHYHARDSRGARRGAGCRGFEAAFRLRLRAVACRVECLVVTMIVLESEELMSESERKESENAGGREGYASRVIAHGRLSMETRARTSVEYVSVGSPCHGSFEHSGS